MKTAQFTTLFFSCLLGLMPAAASAYEIFADGAEVTDQKTGLIWRRCVEGMNWDGSTCADDPSIFSHEEALQRAAAQASSGSAWRLPTIKELSSIYIANKSINHAGVDQTAFPATPSDWFWSSSPFDGQPNHAWYLSFAFGSTGGSDRNNANYVRLVRDAH